MNAHRSALAMALALVAFGSRVEGQGAPAAPIGAHVVPVVTHEFAFTLPDSLPAGLTTFRLRNEGRQPHHLMLYRLDTGKRLGDVLAALSAGGAHPAWMHAAGGPERGAAWRRGGRYGAAHAGPVCRLLSREGPRSGGPLCQRDAEVGHGDGRAHASRSTAGRRSHADTARLRHSAFPTRPRGGGTGSQCTTRARSATR